MYFGQEAVFVVDYNGVSSRRGTHEAALTTTKNIHRCRDGVVGEVVGYTSSAYSRFANLL